MYTRDPVSEEIFKILTPVADKVVARQTLVPIADKRIINKFYFSGGLLGKLTFETYFKGPDLYLVIPNSTSGTLTLRRHTLLHLEHASPLSSCWIHFTLQNSA